MYDDRRITGQDIQVTKDHYDFLSYVNMERWCSYYTQVEEIIKSGAQNIMLIGVGDGITIDIAKKINPQLQFIKVDFDSELEPDLCADVCELSEYIDENNRPDAIVCCQVLEHIPFGKFEQALEQINKSLKDGGTFILSLPDRGYANRFRIDIPKIHINFFYKMCLFWKREYKFDGEHYWEINVAKKYSAKRVRQSIQKYFTIQREYHVKYNDYHRFFIGKKR